jgi:hypothetical protein
MPAPAGPIISMSETAQSARVLSQDPSVVFTVVIPGSRSVGGLEDGGGRALRATTPPR